MKTGVRNRVFSHVMQSAVIFAAICIAEFYHSSPVVAHTSYALQTFEVASIKVEPAVDTQQRVASSGMSCHGADGVRFAKAGSASANVTAPQGHCLARFASLRGMVSFAYGVDAVSGGPDWASPGTKAVFFSVDAKAENTSTTTLQQLGEMLQAMLNEQFKLKIRRETMQTDGFALVIDEDKGFKLAEVKSGVVDNPDLKPTLVTSIPGLPDWELGWNVFKGTASMNAVSSTIARAGTPVPLPVVDQTGLKGEYDVNLRFPVGPGGSTLTTNGDQLDRYLSLRQSMSEKQLQQLGLRLRRQKIPIETIVIDQAEKPLLQ